MNTPFNADLVFEFDSKTLARLRFVSSRFVHLLSGVTGVGLSPLTTTITRTYSHLAYKNNNLYSLTHPFVSDVFASFLPRLLTPPSLSQSVRVSQCRHDVFNNIMIDPRGPKKQRGT